MWGLLSIASLAVMHCINARRVMQSSSDCFVCVTPKLNTLVNDRDYNAALSTAKQLNHLFSGLASAASITPRSAFDFGCNFSHTKKESPNLIFAMARHHYLLQAVPMALADFVEENNLQGKMKFGDHNHRSIIIRFLSIVTAISTDLFVGASAGPEVEDRWAKNDMLRMRWPFQSSKILNKSINKFAHRVWDFSFVKKK